MRLPRPRDWLLPALVAAAAVAAFLPALSCGFVNWDDPKLIVDNPFYRGLGPSHIRWMFTNMVNGHYQPVSWLTFGLDYTLWGMNPAGYHLTNLLLHGANAALFVLLARNIMLAAAPGRDRGWTLDLSAAFAAMVFAVHPLRTESVAWVTERRDVLSAFFYLAAILCHLRAAAGPEAAGRPWRAASLALYVPALLSKSMTITLPMALIILDVYPLRRLPSDPRRWIGAPWRGRVLEKAPFFLIAGVLGLGIYVSTTWIGQIRWMADRGLLERLATACYGLMFYPVKTLWPARLIPLYELAERFDPFQPMFAVAAAAVVAGACVVWRWGRRFPGIGAACMFYVVSIAPVLGIIPHAEHIAADRYSYIPGMGWAVLAGAGLRALLSGLNGRGRVAALAAAGALALGLGRLSWEQTKIWRDSIALWTRVLAVAPRTAVAHNNLAAALALEGGFAQAAGHFRAACRLRPANMEFRRRLSAVLYNLGTSIMDAGRPRNAIPVFEEASALSCGPADLYVNLGLALARTGRPREACRQFARALRVNPGSALAEYNWGNALADLGRLDEARKHYEAALRRSPGMLEAMFNLGNVLARQGRFAEAMGRYRAVMLVAPRHPDLRNNMEAVRRLMAAAPSASR